MEQKHFSAPATLIKHVCQCCGSSYIFHYDSIYLFYLNIGKTYTIANLPKQEITIAPFTSKYFI